MRRTIVLIFILLFIAIVSAEAEQYRLTIIASCDDYNHVGREWQFDYSVSGQEFQFCMNDGSQKLQSALQTPVEVENGCEITTIVTETDKYPDVGKRTDELELSWYPRYGCNGFEQKIEVTEGSGRYSGCTCVWKILWLFEKVE